MEVDEDNDDVVVIEDNDEEESNITSPVDKNDNRPIMRLFDRLISSGDKHSTILTNAQMISILKIEFNMDIDKLHHVQITIYLNVIKTFLKDWPEWFEFDRIINKFKTQGQLKSEISIRTILEQKYKNIKEYLRMLIDKATDLAKDTIAKIEIEKDTKKCNDLENIVLEVYCSRRQLNELFYNQPNPLLNDTIFNLVDNQQKSLSLQTFPMESLLNWMSVRVSIELKFFLYTRYTSHRLTHTLINERNSLKVEKEPLNTNIQFKDTKTPCEYVNKTKIYKLMTGILTQVTEDTERQIVTSLFNVINKDLEYMSAEEFKIPGTYRQVLNKYRYERRLNQKIGSNNDDYNLCVLETITPTNFFCFGKFTNLDEQIIPPALSWLKIECSECKVKFSGDNLKETFVEHFHLNHNNEKDWHCDHCNGVFPMAELAGNHWRHVC